MIIKADSIYMKDLERRSEIKDTDFIFMVDGRGIGHRLSYKLFKDKLHQIRQEQKVGTIVQAFRDELPGALKCDGREYLISDYPLLAQQIKEKYEKSSQLNFSGSIWRTSSAKLGQSWTKRYKDLKPDDWRAKRRLKGYMVEPEPTTPGYFRVPDLVGRFTRGASEKHPDFYILAGKPQADGINKILFESDSNSGNFSGEYQCARGYESYRKTWEYAMEIYGTPREGTEGDRGSYQNIQKCTSLSCADARSVAMNSSYTPPYRICLDFGLFVLPQLLDSNIVASSMEHDQKTNYEYWQALLAIYQKRGQTSEARAADVARLEETLFDVVRPKNVAVNYFIYHDAEPTFSSGRSKRYVSIGADEATLVKTFDEKPTLSDEDRFLVEDPIVDTYAMRFDGIAEQVNNEEAAQKVGTIVYSTTETPPPGTLPCEGQWLRNTEYPELGNIFFKPALEKFQKIRKLKEDLADKSGARVRELAEKITKEVNSLSRESVLDPLRAEMNVLLNKDFNNNLVSMDIKILVGEIKALGGDEFEKAFGRLGDFPLPDLRGQFLRGADGDKIPLGGRQIDGIRKIEIKDSIPESRFSLLNTVRKDFRQEGRGRPLVETNRQQIIIRTSGCFGHGEEGIGGSYNCDRVFSEDFDKTYYSDLHRLNISQGKLGIFSYNSSVAEVRPVNVPLYFWIYHGKEYVEQDDKLAVAVNPDADLVNRLPDKENLAVGDLFLVDNGVDDTYCVRWNIIKGGYDRERRYAMVGVVVPGFSSEPPSGSLLCDGSLVNKADYYDLFSVIGDKFKQTDDGDTTQFRLPDLRGQFLRGADGETIPLGGKQIDGISRTVFGWSPGHWRSITFLLRGMPNFSGSDCSVPPPALKGVFTMECIDRLTAKPYFSHWDYDTSNYVQVFRFYKSFKCEKYVNRNNIGVRKSDGSAFNCEDYQKMIDEGVSDFSDIDFFNEVRPMNVAVNWFIYY